MKPISAKTIDQSSAPVLPITTLRSQCEIVPIDADSDGNETHPDDALLLGFLEAAVDHAEKFTGRSIRQRTLEFALDCFPSSVYPDGGIEVPYPPLAYGIALTYGDDSDSELEPETDFTIDTYGDKAVLRPLNSWPSIVTPSPNRVKYRYKAGYSYEGESDSEFEQLPGAIRAALLLFVDHLYRNRSATTDKGTAELPLGVEALLRPWRVLTGMA